MSVWFELVLRALFAATAAVGLNAVFDHLVGIQRNSAADWIGWFIIMATMNYFIVVRWLGKWGST